MYGKEWRREGGVTDVTVHNMRFICAQLLVRDLSRDTMSDRSLIICHQENSIALLSVCLIYCRVHSCHKSRADILSGRQPAENAEVLL